MPGVPPDALDQVKRVFKNIFRRNKKPKTTTTTPQPQQLQQQHQPAATQQAVPAVQSAQQSNAPAAAPAPTVDTTNNTTTSPGNVSPYHESTTTTPQPSQTQPHVENAPSPLNEHSILSSDRALPPSTPQSSSFPPELSSSPRSAVFAVNTQVVHPVKQYLDTNTQVKAAAPPDSIYSQDGTSDRYVPGHNPSVEDDDGDSRYPEPPVDSAHAQEPPLVDHFLKHTSHAHEPPLVGHFQNDTAHHDHTVASSAEDDRHPEPINHNAIVPSTEDDKQPKPIDTNSPTKDDKHSAPQSEAHTAPDEETHSTKLHISSRHVEPSEPFSKAHAVLPQQGETPQANEAARRAPAIYHDEKIPVMAEPPSIRALTPAPGMVATSGPLEDFPFR